MSAHNLGRPLRVIYQLKNAKKQFIRLEKLLFQEFFVTIKVKISIKYQFSRLPATMKSRFLFLAAVVSARTLEPSKNSNEWKFKLDKYQAITGIDYETKNEIWNIMKYEQQ